VLKFSFGKERAQLVGESSQRIGGGNDKIQKRKGIGEGEEEKLSSRRNSAERGTCRFSGSRMGTIKDV